MPYKALIVDDEPLARQGVRERLNGFPAVTVVEECEDGMAALEAIRRHNPDLVFLDIQMPIMNGFEVLQRLPKTCKPAIIFLTAYDQFALRAFDFHALDYLLKPIDSERFAEAVKRACSELKLRNTASLNDRLLGLFAELAHQKTNSYTERFIVRSGNRISFVLADEIDWIEAVGDYVRLHVREKRPLLRESMNNLERQLDPEKFVRVHRSTIVSVSRIEELRILPNRELQLYLTNGTNLRVSRTYRSRLDPWLGATSPRP